MLASAVVPFLRGIFDPVWYVVSSTAAVEESVVVVLDAQPDRQARAMVHANSDFMRVSLL